METINHLFRIVLNLKDLIWYTYMLFVNIRGNSFAFANWCTSQRQSLVGERNSLKVSNTIYSSTASNSKSNNVGEIGIPYYLNSGSRLICTTSQKRPDSISKLQLYVHFCVWFIVRIPLRTHANDTGHYQRKSCCSCSTTFKNCIENVSLKSKLVRPGTATITATARWGEARRDNWLMTKLCHTLFQTTFVLHCQQQRHQKRKRVWPGNTTFTNCRSTQIQMTVLRVSPYHKGIRC